MKLGLVDYGAGNLHSVEHALLEIGAPSQKVREASDLEGIDALVLPGVGACVDCARQLKEQELWEPLREWIIAGRPYFGICLGYQILFDHSEEFEGTAGLGVFEGKVKRFPKNGQKVPHMGWNNLRLVNPSDPLWAGLPADPYVYFVHSFYPEPKDDSLVSAWTEYSLNFAAAIRWGNLVATQFHPEKSQSIGLRILRNFVAEQARA